MSSSNPNPANVLLGIFFTFLAGSSITLGNFAISRASTNNNSIMAISLGLAAGVMCYVALVELFSESTESFEKAEAHNPRFLTIICFFSGWLLTAGIDLALHRWGGGHGHSHSHGHSAHAHDHGPGASEVEDGEHSHGALERKDTDSPRQKKLHKQADETELVSMSLLKRTNNSSPSQGDHSPNNSDTDTRLEIEGRVGDVEEDRERLQSLSLLTSISVSLHNFPEGLAVLASSIDEPAVGATLAVAVALHNLPIGVSIALPVFYTTRSRLKAFLATFAVGMTQPLGAIIGYYLMKEIFSGTTCGILFAGVSGMMMYITLKELLPMARQYDKNQNLVTTSIFLGMLLVALTLLASGHGGGEHHH